MAFLKSKGAQSPGGGVRRYFETSISHEMGSPVTVRALHGGYCAWCKTSALEVLPIAEFALEFQALGPAKQLIAGRERFVGIGLAEHKIRRR